MAAAPIPQAGRHLKLKQLTAFPNLRALAWHGDVLYASRGYRLLRAKLASDAIHWEEIARYSPEWWRNISSRSRLAFRLMRDGFHALAITRGGNLVAAVPGAIATLRPGETEFQITHRLLHGTRPLHITSTADGRAFWGEYFDNPHRDEVHIYVSNDGGLTWTIANTFPPGSIRHVHNVLYDRWINCLWVLTGDYGHECRILRAELDFTSTENVLCGNQQARAVAAVVAEEGLYFASDTPLEKNFIYLLDRRDCLQELASIPGSSIYGARNLSGLFFSTMVEPSSVNLRCDSTLFGSAGGETWNELKSWRKDQWPMKLFQYGNTILPDGENSTEFLAASTIAVENADLQSTLWRTSAE